MDGDFGVFNDGYPECVSLLSNFAYVSCISRSDDDDDDDDDDDK